MDKYLALILGARPLYSSIATNKEELIVLVKPSSTKKGVGL